MVFVYEKSLIIVMLVYSISFSLLGTQYIVADVFHVQMTDFNGNPIKNVLITGVGQQSNGQSTLNAIYTNSTCTTPTCQNKAESATTYLLVAATYAWNIFMLISGLYVFQFLYQLGVPIIFMMGFIALYLFFLVRSMMGWIRGI